MPKDIVSPSDNWLERMFGLGSAERDKKKLALNIRERRLTGRNLGPDDLSGLIPMAGTTRFLTGGVPNIAARSAATQKFLDAMKAMGPKAEQASTLFAERYPRVAAHIKPVGEWMERGLKGVADVNRRLPRERVTQVRLSTDPHAMQDIEETLLHEGTHVAQDLGNPGTYNMYRKYHEIMEPIIGKRAAYATNPFEKSANAVAARKLGTPGVDPVNALELFKQAVEKLPPGSPERIELARSMMRR